MNKMIVIFDLLFFSGIAFSLLLIIFLSNKEWEDFKKKVDKIRDKIREKIGCFKE